MFLDSFLRGGSKKLPWMRVMEIEGKQSPKYAVAMDDYFARVMSECVSRLVWPSRPGSVLRWDRLDFRTVDGGEIKLKYSMDFVEGGHDVVYSFVPPRTVWIDHHLSNSQKRFVMAHELVERFLMESYRMPYSVAHPISNKYEKAFRMEVLKI